MPYGISLLDRPTHLFTYMFGSDSRPSFKGARQCWQRNINWFSTLISFLLINIFYVFFLETAPWTCSQLFTFMNQLHPAHESGQGQKQQINNAYYGLPPLLKMHSPERDLQNFTGWKPIMRKKLPNGNKNNKNEERNQNQILVLILKLPITTFSSLLCLL